jgi:hypothetical protein
MRSVFAKGLSLPIKVRSGLELSGFRCVLDSVTRWTSFYAYVTIARNGNLANETKKNKYLQISQ